MKGARPRKIICQMHQVDVEDTVVDFNDASLYLPLAQTVFSICVCASVSVLSCWLSPNGAVSAVRTLALCSAAGGMLMRRPVRIGKAHGITVVFSALQLSIPLYLGTLVVEQLVHTCSIDSSHAPSWRHVIFHTAVFAMVCSGFMRARFPLQDTDRPFIITVLALMVIAITPPPAIALVGPLCQSASLWDASDRLVRAFCFGILYCVTVYTSTRTKCTNYSNTSIVFFRSASACLWVSGALVWWLPLAAAQCAIMMHARATYTTNPSKEYSKISSSVSTDDDDVEANIYKNLETPLDDPVEEQARLFKNVPIYAESANFNSEKVSETRPEISANEDSENGLLDNLNFYKDIASSESPAPREPMGKLPFQKLVFTDDSQKNTSNSFSDSVAKAIAIENASSK